MGIRTELETVLRAELTPPVAVYAFPVDVPIVPGVILAPGDPYQTPLTFGRNGHASTVQWNLRVAIILPRGEPATSLDALESMRKEITDALSLVPGASWSGLSGVGETTNADVPAIGGTIDVAIRRGDETV